MNTKKNSFNLESGVYSISDAARIINAPKSSLRSWAKTITDNNFLNFYELIELLIFKMYKEKGVKSSHIKKTWIKLSEQLNTKYPFAHKKLQTDGFQLIKECDDICLNVAECQVVFEYIKELYKDIEFDKQLAVKWWPIGKNHNVVVDPKWGFGEPVIDKKGIRTKNIYKTYIAEKDVSVVADWYGISDEEVKSAIKYETECTDKQQAA